jgi:hypothetical protein
MGGCLCTWYRQMMFRLNNVDKGILLIRVQEVMCIKCKKKRNMYLKHKPVEGWFVCSDSQYTVVRGQLYESGIPYHGDYNVLNYTVGGI